MENPATLFELFGGITKLAAAIEEPVSTVSSWNIVGRIPATKQPRVLAAAERMGLPITADHLVFPKGRPADVESAAPTDNQFPDSRVSAGGEAPRLAPEAGAEAAA